MKKQAVHNARKLWKMVILMIIFSVHASLHTAVAQQMYVQDFTRIKRPLWKRSDVAADKQRAIIDLATTEKGFTFLADGKEPAEAEEGEGVITLRVPHQTRYLTIKHPDFGVLTWRVPAKYLKRKKHYRATLSAYDPTKPYKPQKQWVVIGIAPPHAIVTIDSVTTLVNDGQLSAFLPLGPHHWQAESPFYEQQADSFLLTDTARINLDVKLQPAWAYVAVSTPWQGGDIYIDGLLTGQERATSRRLPAGQHRLTVFRYGLCIYDGTFTVGHAEKRDITLTDRDFEPRPLKKEDMLATLSTQTPSEPYQTAVPTAPVTLKAPDADTEIWIDRERMGTGQWNGQLAQGYHIVSTKKDGTESSSTPLWITDLHPLQLDLAVPASAMAMLNIHSNVTAATIYINDVPAGTTPVIISHLPAGRAYHVTLKKDGYKDARITVSPQGNAMTDVKVRMKRK